MLGGGVVIVMVRQLKEALTQVRSRLKREQAERTRKRIAELLGVAEQESDGEEEAERGSEVEELCVRADSLWNKLRRSQRGL